MAIYSGLTPGGGDELSHMSWPVGNDAAPLRRTRGGRVGATARRALAAASILLCACASTKARTPEAAAPTPAAPAAGGEPPAAQPAAPEVPTDPCKLLETPENAAIDRTRLKLARTMCSATVWFDGLFGERHAATVASSGFGRMELSLTHSQFDGNHASMRFNARYPLPNLERKFHIFVARENPQEYIQDRMESLALRSQFLNVETQEQWAAGLGYSLSESESQATTFRLGLNLSTAPKVFTQVRYRRDFTLSERVKLYFHETLFWTNRDGFGATTDVAVDRVLTPTLMSRFDTVGTISQSTSGVDWRTSYTLYHSLAHLKAIGGQVFVRGETRAEVPLHEFGLNAIYRRPLGRDWLFGEGIVGYSWPREHLGQPREGSLLVGIGIDVAFEF